MPQLSGIMDNHYVREEWICDNCGKVTIGQDQSTYCLYCTGEWYTSVGGHKKVLHLETKNEIIIKDGSHVFIQK